MRKPRSERGAGRYEARNERTTKDLRKQIEQARPIQLNRLGLAWAASGKDPGLTPEFILDWALRGNRFGPDDLAEVRWEEPMDWVATKQEWFGAVREARALVERLPARDMGCLYLDAQGHPVCPDPDAPGFHLLTRHFGCLKGAWPRVGEP